VSVTKKDLTLNITKKLKLSGKDSFIVLESFIGFIKKNYKHNINIHGFGSFSFKHTPKRIGRDPKSKKEFIIRARRKLTYKPSDTVKKRIN
tara:strand:- start:25 stop:297 length:273 start_codon:yes stop_codon:yes gene_type:complete